MTVRELPLAEWPRLLEADCDLPGLPNKGATIFVAEDHLGDIVGYWMARQVWHIEPCWVRPDHRGGLVVGRLWRKIRQFLDTCRISRAFSMTEYPLVEDYLRRLGFKSSPEKVYYYKWDTKE